MAPEFRSNLLAAIDRLRRRSLDQLTPLLHDSVPSDVLADELIVALDHAPGEPAVLVLDDLQVVADQPELMRHLPSSRQAPAAGLQLVVVARSLPALALDRARLDGRLAMVDFDDLRFSRSRPWNCSVAWRPTPTTSGWVRPLVAFGGWAAGLQLFTQASGSTDEMQITTDYLRAEAFGGEPEELVELLREVAVVGRVNVRLAAILHGRDDADVLLRARLRARSVPVATWWRTVRAAPARPRGAAGAARRGSRARPRPACPRRPPPWKPMASSQMRWSTSCSPVAIARRCAC